MNLGRIRWNQDVVDVAIALILAAVALWGGWQSRDRESVIGIALLLMQTLPVAVRRRNPMRVLVVTGVSITLYFGLHFPEVNSWTGVFLAFYTVAANEPRARATTAVSPNSVPRAMHRSA